MMYQSFFFFEGEFPFSGRISYACVVTSRRLSHRVASTQGAPVNNFRPAVLTGQRGRELLERIQALSTVEIS